MIPIYLHAVGKAAPLAQLSVGPGMSSHPGILASWHPGIHSAENTLHLRSAESLFATVKFQTPHRPVDQQ